MMTASNDQPNVTHTELQQQVYEAYMRGRRDALHDETIALACAQETAQRLSNMIDRVMKGVSPEARAEIEAILLQYQRSHN